MRAEQEELKPLSKEEFIEFYESKKSKPVKGCSFWVTLIFSNSLYEMLCMIDE